MSTMPNTRRPGIKQKLLQIPEEQQAALKRWLIEEKVIYAVAIQRLKEQFGVSTSLDAISRFYHQQCVTKSEPSAPTGKVLLDVEFQATGKVRLQIIEGHGSISLVGRDAATQPTATDESTAPTNKPRIH